MDKTLKFTIDRTDMEHYFILDNLNESKSFQVISFNYPETRNSELGIGDEATYHIRGPDKYIKKIQEILNSECDYGFDEFISNVVERETEKEFYTNHKYICIWKPEEEPFEVRMTTNFLDKARDDMNEVIGEHISSNIDEYYIFEMKMIDSKNYKDFE